MYSQNILTFIPTIENPLPNCFPPSAIFSGFFYTTLERSPQIPFAPSPTRVLYADSLPLLSAIVLPEAERPILRVVHQWSPDLHPTGDPSLHRTHNSFHIFVACPDTSASGHTSRQPASVLVDIPVRRRVKQVDAH